jgi:PAS domain S-box-containing protein
MNDPAHTPLPALAKALADLSFTSVMVTLHDPNQGGSKIVYVNDAFTELTGYRAADVLGKTPGLLQGPKTDREVLDRLSDDLRHGRSFHGQTVNYRKDGSEFQIEWKVTQVTESDGHHYAIAVQRQAA